MPRPRVFLRIDLSNAWKFTKRLERKPTDTLQSAAKHYLAWLRSRYMNHVKGGGIWQKLAKSTIKKKKKEKVKYGFRAPIRWILYQSGTLYKSMDVKTAKDKVIVGVVLQKSGPPTYRNKLAARIGAFHQLGMGSNPKRELIVLPNTTELAVMRERTRKDIDNIIAKENRGR